MKILVVGTSTTKHQLFRALKTHPDISEIIFLGITSISAEIDPAIKQTQLIGPDQLTEIKKGTIYLDSQVMTKRGPVLFVYGGLTFKYAKRWTIDDTNQALTYPITDEQKVLKEILLSDGDSYDDISIIDHPIWAQLYDPNNPEIFQGDQLEMALALYDTTTIVTYSRPLGMILALQKDGESYIGIKSSIMLVDLENDIISQIKIE